ncbi:hypothetical protein GYH30_027898 [Glycine max]|uniref:F-box domain-containing protein n=2 Tax=Glycine subgen. Soja TaxID=1462606 RepID=K7LJ79_SOYBN|nr:hypothetical protein GYH30_027898 [Glycine max]
MKKTKRERISRREREKERDRLSELPDCILLYIMKFMNTKYAVQTCILSKRWKNLWKRLIVLTFYPWDFRRVVNFKQFVSKVLSCRNGSISLLNLCILAHSKTISKLLNRIMKYVVLHDLPALKDLFMAKVTFTRRDNSYVKPFSTCNLLNTLSLSEFSLHNDANVLFISNSNLFSLKLWDSFQHKIVLSTPNLSSLTFIEYLGFIRQSISSACNLSCLEEGTIETSTNISYSVVIGWLQVLTNVNTLTLSYDTLMIMLRDLSNPSTMRTQPLCFVRLESLKVKMNSCLTISDEEVNRVIEYLLHNSPMSRVNIFTNFSFVTSFYVSLSH